MATTMNDVLREWAEKYPEREAFTFFNRHGRHSICTSKELFQLAGRFAFELRRQGFQKGEVICNAIPNSVERLVTDYGVILAGCVTVNCQVMERDGADFWHMAQLSGCVGAILPRRDHNPPYNLFKQFLPGVIPDTGYVDVSIPKAPKLRKILLVDRYDPSSTEASNRNTPSLLTHLKESEGGSFIHQPEPSELVYIFQTSGSTGYSKLIPRTHEEVLIMARVLSGAPDEAMGKTFNDRSFGWVGGFPFGYFGHGSCILAQDFFDGEQAQNVRELWKGIAGEKCPIAFILPRDIIRLVEEFKIDPPEFKTEVIITGGQPITKVIMEALGVLTKALLLSYASSEASVVTNKYIADKADFQDFMCGTPFPGTDTCLRVVDEHMHDLESGKEGRILIKSSRVLRGYFNQVPASPIFTPDGWFITGDWGWLDENGDLFVSDRQDNVIHHGAILVYPSWPESILSRNPNVKEAAVIGIPDVTGGSKLCACVVLNKDASVSKNDLMKFYEDSFIKSHRQEYIPKLSFLQIMEEIPKTFNSKVDQRTLRSVMLDKLNIPDN